MISFFRCSRFFDSICYKSVCKQIRTWKLAVFRWFRKKCLLNGIMSCLFDDSTDTRWQWQLEEKLICSHFHMFSLGMRMKALLPHPRAIFPSDGNNWRFPSGQRLKYRTSAYYVNKSMNFSLLLLCIRCSAVQLMAWHEERSIKLMISMRLCLVTECRVYV